MLHGGTDERSTSRLIGHGLTAEIVMRLGVPVKGDAELGVLQFH
jgi:hypothetical protein